MFCHLLYEVKWYFTYPALLMSKTDSAYYRYTLRNGSVEKTMAQPSWLPMSIRIYHGVVSGLEHGTLTDSFGIDM